MKKITLLMFAMLAWAGIATAQNVVLDNTHGLPGTNVTLDGGHPQYQWTSEQFTAPENFKVLRLTFLANSNNNSPAGYPCIALAEFYLYDVNGEKVALETSMFSSNATETNEGSMEQICNGVESGSLGKYDWYWHSYWSTNVGDYHYLELAVPEAADLSKFQFGYTSRQHPGSPAKMLVTMGASTEDVASQVLVALEKQKLSDAIAAVENVLNKVKEYPNIIGSFSSQDIATVTAIIQNAKNIEAGNNLDEIKDCCAQLVALQSAYTDYVIYPEVGKVYMIESPYFYNVQSVHKVLLNNNGAPGWSTLDALNKNHYWVVENTENGMALKNLGNEKYIKGQAANNTGWTFVDAGSEAPFTLVPVGSGECAIMITGRHLHTNNHNGGHNPSGNIVSWETNSANTGSAWKFLEVTDSYELNMAKGELTEAIDIAKLSLEYDTKKIELQVGDNTADNYLWCNEPETSEGKIDYLIDGITGNDKNFFHSAWNGRKEPVHYLQVDLGSTPISQFVFNYVTRTGASYDFPTQFTIEGSNDNSAFEQIAVVNTNTSSANISYTSSLLGDEEKSYSYLRFKVTQTTDNRIYFHLAEFGLSSYGLKDTEENLAKKAIIDEATAVLADENSTIEDIESELEKVKSIYMYSQLQALIEEAQTIVDGTSQDILGDDYGWLSKAGYDKLVSELEIAKGFAEDDQVADIEAEIEALRAAIDAFGITVPKAGAYLRIQTIADRVWSGDNTLPYLSSVNYPEMSRAAYKQDGDEATSIFYTPDGHQLLSYASGHYLVEMSKQIAYNGVQNEGEAFEFKRAGSIYGVYPNANYNIVFNGSRSLYARVNPIPDDNGVWVANGHTDAGDNVTSSDANYVCYTFRLEEVTSLPVTVSAANYATFYTPVAVKIPAGVEVYYASAVEDEYVILNPITGTIPANTGVILKNAGSYEFEITTDVPAIEGNLLKGTVARTQLAQNGRCYVLGLDANSVVGMYKAAKGEDNSVFFNSGHKAYLELPEASKSNSYRFDFGGTTGIETIETSAQDNVIYDLTGRRVEKAVKGLYIVNGKKVLVK